MALNTVMAPPGAMAGEMVIAMVTSEAMVWGMDICRGMEMALAMAMEKNRTITPSTCSGHKGMVKKMMMNTGYGSGTNFTDDARVSGYGFGYEYGNDNGHGCGDGSTSYSGYGSGSGHGYGDGYGYGNGNGSGWGTGCGYGDGDGWGIGYGYGIDDYPYNLLTK